MKTGLSSYTYGWAVGQKNVDAFELIRRAKEQSFVLLQLGDNVPLDMWGREQLCRLHCAAQDAGVALEVGMRGFTKERAYKYIEIARLLHARILRVVIDMGTYLPSIDQVSLILDQIKETLAQAEVTVALENHDRFTSNVLAQIVSAANSRLIGICLDTANSYGAGEDVGTVLHALLPLAVNVHLKDFWISRLGHGQGFTIEGRPLGKGMLRVREILEQKALICPEANVILELWTPPEKRMEDTIDKEARWASESITFLQTILP